LSKEIVAFTGYARSGKDTCANILIEKGFKHHKFATKIYEMIACFLDTTVDEIVRMKVQNIDIPNTKTSVRSALQTIGTEWGREYIDYDIWAKRLTDSIKFNRIVISDLRFVNEVLELQRFSHLNGYKCTLIGLTRDSEEPQIHHLSEQDISTIIRDYTDHIITNNDSLCELEDQLKRIIKW